MKHKAQMHELLLLSAFEELLCWTADRWTDGWTDTSGLQCRVSSCLQTNTELN